MRRWLMVTTILIVLGCGPSLAQTAPASGGAAPIAVSPPPTGMPGSALGAIQMNLAPPLAGNSPGNISLCATSGAGPGAASFPVDVTDTSAASSAGFAASEASPGCSAAPPPSGPGLVSGSEFSSGAVPLSATESGGSGLSPLIAVPIPADPAAACNNAASGADTTAQGGTTVSPGC